MARHRSAAVPLAWLYAALIVYASLYPFTGWRLPGTSPWAYLTLPWPRWWTGFDLWSNLLGYLPFGVLLFGAAVRSGARSANAVFGAVLIGFVLSLALETMQNFVPPRVPSNVDLALNALGAASGALLGLLVHALGGIGRWQAVRDRWLVRRSAGGVALLLIWPFGLLFPTPVPLGVGQVLARLQEGLADLLDGSSLAAHFEAWLTVQPPFAALSPPAEQTAVALGLVAPCMVAFVIAQPGWRRPLLAFGCALLGFATTTLSAALNFGPEHALAWSTPNSMAGLALGLALAMPLALLPRRAAAGVGLLALGALIVLIAQAPADPYFAERLQDWEEGRFIRFHGAAQWVGWLWPFVALVYLLVRLGVREDE